MKFRVVAMAALAVAGHHHLMAGYRVVGESPAQGGYAAPAAVASPVSVPGERTAAADADSAARIRALEAENAALKARLRDAEMELNKRRPPSAAVAGKTTIIGFATASTRLSQPAAENARLVMRARHAKSIEIVGHADNTGDPHLNRRIALARAQSVKDFLVRNGISAHLITVRQQAGVYYDSNDTEQGRTANRRATITFH